MGEILAILFLLAIFAIFIVSAGLVAIPPAVWLVLVVGGIIVWIVIEDRKQKENKLIIKTKVLSSYIESSVTLTRSNRWIKTTFMVYYADGSHKAETVNNGSSRYNFYMSKLDEEYDEPVNDKPIASTEIDSKPNIRNNPPILKKNQLGANDYVIGKDIPSGIYDVIWVWGHGSVTLSKDETTTLGATKFFKWVGNCYDYEQRQCMNIVCEEGNHLHVDGNIIVEIRKSKPVEIDL